MRLGCGAVVNRTNTDGVRRNRPQKLPPWVRLVANAVGIANFKVAEITPLGQTAPVGSDLTGYLGGNTFKGLAAKALRLSLK